VVITDPLEDALPPVGLVTFEDIETGEVIEFDTSGAGAAEYRRRIERQRIERDAALRRMNVDVVEVHTDRPYVDAGTEILQFSPTDKLEETERALAEWMRQQGAPG